MAASDVIHASWHADTVAEVERAMETSGHGLDNAEVAARQVRYGENRLEETAETPIPVIFARQFLDPLIFIMLAALAVTLALGAYLDASVIGVALALNAIVGTTQERQAEKSVRSLQSLVVPRARVVREGREQEVPTVGLVPGDVVLLESGHRVPADLRLKSVTQLQIDESLLTGESAVVTKRVEPVPEDMPLGDRRCMAYTGSVVTSGRGSGIVVATGERTQLGAIAGLIRSERDLRTPMQDRLSGLARIIGIAVLGVSALAFVSGILLGEPVREMFMVAVALAVAAVPEGMPVAVTVTMAIGVRRMARRNAVIRRLPAVETLGSTTVIGSDKTGTLTENRMTVLEIWAGGRPYRIKGRPPEGEILDDEGLPAAIDDSRALHLTLLTGVLTNEADAYRTGTGLRTSGDPTEVALLVSAMTAGMEPSEVRAAHPMDVELPFEPTRRFSASVRRRHGEHALYVKGAPEVVIAMCTGMVTDEGIAPLDPDAVAAAVADMARRGLRVLAFAYRPLPQPALAVASLEKPSGLLLCGLQAMADPPRPGVRESIAACGDAGIRVLMITGDHAATAGAIADRLGISGDGRVVDGARLRALKEDEAREAVREVSVFARVAPEQKLQIVNHLQDDGEVVAVTGDGVNDAPALKAAQIGVAMGRDGTDVAREAADMVLTDDNFESIVSAVEQGRVTFDNVRKVTFFLISTGVGTVAAILITLWLGWPLLMLPAQLLWLNLVTSGLQDMALAFEPGEKDVLARAPRGTREGIMSPMLWERAVVAGAVMAAGTLWLFQRELEMTGSLQRAQTVALTTMVVFQVFQAGNARSERLSLFRMSPFANRFLFIATAAAVGVHVLALYLPQTQYVLRVEPIEIETWIRIVAVASSLLVAMELHKIVRRRFPMREGRRRRAGETR